ncbi:hypothetical protein CKO28_13310 [Rhodovibrio sodomensis]|uniref:Uncharacterized protein n=1 Tax=Rhodovibrio sodomensis TaxID=1088 RepID=A0ABS1DEX8_9PROT|nr:hypothetical protein [Rhodovibrio sodomensis]MBK1669010.1 hypothetical protein [Rhodovibrio sodomensis]
MKRKTRLLAAAGVFAAVAFGAGVAPGSGPGWGLSAQAQDTGSVMDNEPESFARAGERQGKPCAAPIEEVPEDASLFEKFQATAMKRIQNETMRKFAGDDWCKGDYGEKFKEKWKVEEKLENSMRVGGKAAEQAVKNAPTAEEVNDRWSKGVQRFERMMQEQEGG